MPKDTDLPSDSERLARIEAAAERTSNTIADHISSETKTMDQMQAMLGQVLEATNATRSEGATRGARQDRAIEMVSGQVQSLGSTIAQVDTKLDKVDKRLVKVEKRVDHIEDDRGGIHKQISEHEIFVDEALSGEQAKVQTLDDKVDRVDTKVDGLKTQIGDIRLATSAITSALALHVPKADGSGAPPPNTPTAIERLSRDNRVGALATVFVALYLAAQQLWPLIFPHR